MKPEELDGDQIVAGGYTLHIGPADGNLVKEPAIARAFEPRLRRERSVRLPPAFSGLLDREREVERAGAALARPGPAWVEFYAPPGAGKTSLLRYLAHHPLAAGYRDGVLYVGMKRQPAAEALEDLLQLLFEAFYEQPQPTRPDEAQMRQALQGLQALLLLDDCDMSRRDLDTLQQAAAGCSFVIASTRPRLEGAGVSIALPGLPSGAALALFERWLGRFLDSSERHAARVLCAGLDGRPMRIQQAAALARDSRCSIASLSGQVLSGQALAGKVLASLSEAERRIVFALAVLDGAPVTAGHLAALAGPGTAASLLERLERKAVIQREAGRYTLAADLHEPVLDTWDLSTWLEQGLAVCLEWADGQQQRPEALLEDAPVLRRWMEWAAGRERWKEVLRLALALDGPAARACRWGTWRQALQMGLEASQALGGRAVEAWGLHQLGTLALCLGERDEARAFLVRALRIRENLGDVSGAAVTRYNLGLLIHPRPNRLGGWAAGSPGRSVGEQASPPAGDARGRPGSSPAAGPAARAQAPGGRFRYLGGIGILLIALLLAVPMSAMLLGYGRYRSWTLANATRLVEGTQASAGRPPSGLPTAQAAGTESSLAPALSAALSTPFPPVSATPASPEAPTATPGACGPPAGWVQYTVQRQDTLAALAGETGTSLQGLMFANCLNGISWLSPGEVIWVPRLPPAAGTATWAAESSLAPPAHLTAAVPSTPAAGAAPVSPGLTLTPDRTGLPGVAGVLPAGAVVETPASPSPTPNPTEPPLPDLVVTGWELGSELAANERGELVIPARVVVANQGQAAAGDFVVAVLYDDGTSAAPEPVRFLAFEVSGRSDPAFPHSIVPLAPNSSLAFEGGIHIGPELLGETIRIWAQADSCAGGAPAEGYCQVEESDEDNNLSQPVLSLLPLQPGGILQATAAPW